MNNQGSFQIAEEGEQEIVMTRTFDASPELVFEALTTPKLVQRWLLGPEGWSMPRCEMDVKVGGAYRWVWRNDADGTEMGMGGVYREIVPNERLVATEKFDEAWYQGEALGTFELTAQGGETILKQTMLYESREARDQALKSGMEQGVIASYDRLEQIVARG